MTATTTLDDHRLDEIRTHLTVLAAAEVASARSAPAHPVRRRVAVGTAAAGLLAGGLVAATAFVDSPGPVGTSPAVAIEHVDGWTEIDILDPGASPTEIEAALEAAGVSARIETLDLTPDANGVITLGDSLEVMPNPGQPLFDPNAGFSFTGFDPDSLVIGGFNGVAGDLGLIVAEFPEVDVDQAPPTGDVAVAHASDAEYRLALEEVGVRYAEVGATDGIDIAIRDGAVGVEVVLWVVPA